MSQISQSRRGRVGFEVPHEKFTFFSERGCPAAALRVWPWMQGVHKNPIELCGDTLEHNVEIVSQSNIMKLS